VAGEPIRGSWWGHPGGHAIVDAPNTRAEPPNVVMTRLVNRMVTLVHRRLWPALGRGADRIPTQALGGDPRAHTSTGAHRVREQPMPDWVPSDVQAAQDLSAHNALAELPECLRHA
jgi:hypothetical protein